MACCPVQGMLRVQTSRQVPCAAGAAQLVQKQGKEQGRGLPAGSKPARHPLVVHLMNAGVPLWAARAPAGPQLPKVALLFMTRGVMPMRPVWSAFLAAARAMSEPPDGGEGSGGAGGGGSQGGREELGGLFFSVYVVRGPRALLMHCELPQDAHLLQCLPAALLPCSSAGVLAPLTVRALPSPHFSTELCPPLPRSTLLLGLFSRQQASSPGTKCQTESRFGGGSRQRCAGGCLGVLGADPADAVHPYLKVQGFKGFVTACAQGVCSALMHMRAARRPAGTEPSCERPCKTLATSGSSCCRIAVSPGPILQPCCRRWAVVQAVEAELGLPSLQAAKRHAPPRVFAHKRNCFCGAGIPLYPPATIWLQTMSEPRSRVSVCSRQFPERCAVGCAALGSPPNP